MNKVPGGKKFALLQYQIYLSQVCHYCSTKFTCLGGIDPGPNPDKETNPLAFVNCADNSYEVREDINRYTGNHL